MEATELQSWANEVLPQEVADPEDIVGWAEANFLIADESSFEGRLIQLQPHQKAILRHIFKRGEDGRWPYTTVVYSVPKKCLSPETRILTADLDWVPVGEVVIGDKLLAFDENPIGKRVGGTGRRYRISEVLDTGLAPMLARKLYLADGSVITASHEHKWLIRVRGGPNLVWRETSKLRPNDWLSRYLPIWGRPSNYDDGYMAGVLDGEGHIRRDVREIGVGQKRNVLLDEMHRILSKDGVPYYTSPQRGFYNGHDYTIHYTTISGRPWALYVLGHYRPKRLLEKSLPALDGKMGQIWRLEDVPIMAIEEVSAELVTLQTSTETYFAEGFAAHNSGKTTVASLVARWMAEAGGRFQEIYFVANDFEQAKNRAFSMAQRSVELDPKFNRRKKVLPGHWLVLEKSMTHALTGSKLRALATDYRGEAGGEPTLTVWTELWGYYYESSRRFWVEMTPVPTRSNSIRWVETYAGFEGESPLLASLYELGVKEGRQLTAGELGDLDAFHEAPNWDSLVPCWVNENARLFMYWDSGEIARRMPWQQGPLGEEYYRQQALDMTDSQFARLHLNEWASSESEAIPLPWWDACEDKMNLKPGGKTKVVIGVDAAVSGDSTALACVARHPEERTEVVEFHTMVWYPAPGKAIDYRLTLTPEIDRLCEEYNVVEVAYDEYQLHHWANEQRDKAKSWYRPFGQGAERLVADKQLYDVVRDRRLHHSGNSELRHHIQNCNAKVPGDEENRMRFVKKAPEAKIDAAVALSMATAECLRLNL